MGEHQKPPLPSTSMNLYSVGPRALLSIESLWLDSFVQSSSRVQYTAVFLVLWRSFFLSNITQMKLNEI